MLCYIVLRVRNKPIIIGYIHDHDGLFDSLYTVLIVDKQSIEKSIGKGAKGFWMLNPIKVYSCKFYINVCNCTCDMMQKCVFICMN
jgi:hypothetical protein